MNNDKRIFALVSLGLLLAALLVPFFIAAGGRDDLAVGFGVVAGVLALLFGALSWSDRIGRAVTTALLLMLAVGAVGMAALAAVRFRRAGAEGRTSAAMGRAQPEAARPATRTP